MPGCSSSRGGRSLPDGRVLPLPSDAKFERKVSQRRHLYVTSVAFPGVEVGAILDYRYELRFDSPFYLEPWVFADEVPVLFSEMVFKIPREVQASRWSSDPFRVGLKSETKPSSRGTELRVWAENIRSVPNDPFGLPFADLALKMMLVPTAFHDEFQHTPLLDSWASLCRIAEENWYGKARRKDSGVPAKAKAVAGSAPTPRAKAEALYRFVRDQIQTEDVEGIFLGEGASVAKVLSEGKGNSAEKALLLESLLDAVKIDGRLVWAADRFRGQIDPALPNPVWFDRVLVMVPLDGQRVFLDPSDPALAFGEIQYGYEGTSAVLYDAKKPEGITLPETPFDQNGRRAVVDLSLDDDGRLAGTGELVLTGHHAWEKIDWKDDDQKTLEGWKEWLGDRYKGFAVADVKFEELPDERKVRLTWSMQQREEDVLGDEASLVPSLPLGPVTQPFVQTVRQAAVAGPFPLWRPGRGGAPPALARGLEGGSLARSLETGAAGRCAPGGGGQQGRRADPDLPPAPRRAAPRLLRSSQDYEAARALFAAVEKSDAQTLALVRR